MSGNQQVDRAKMDQAAKQLDDAYNKVDAVQKQMRNAVDDLRPRWQSPASKVFYQATDEFQSAFERTKRTMEQIHTTLVGSQRTYTQNETDQSQATNAILGLLN